MEPFIIELNLSKVVMVKDYNSLRDNQML